MNAIFGCLVALGGILLLIGDLASHHLKVLWLPVALLVLGPAMLLRHHRDEDDDADPNRDDGTCPTCRGSGTVWSDEWNDWRRIGPVRTIRERCPACQDAEVASGPPMP
jgi:hypothetical protein